MTVALYGRAGCSLCVTTEALLRPLLRSDETLTLVDIDTDPELHRRLLLEIPAIGYGDALLPLAVAEHTIRAFLDDCRAAGVEVDAAGRDAEPFVMTTPAGDRS